MRILPFVLSLLIVSAHRSTAADPTPSAPVSPREAISRVTLPEGFRVSLFASEPDVRQPIAFTLDHRGRLWVAENFSYPEWLQPVKEKDRILIFEDSDGDGKFDRRTVFWDQGQTVTGLVPGFGGVFVAATPNLLFIPDRNGDDVPDGPPEIVLDGWDVNARHNLFNALNWGPDGWLYGCNGILSNSKVGRPGTPDAQRVPINCGVWRYHPTRKVFEAVAHGTTNPWGLDFNEYGEMFITNCVIPHLFHVVPGARFERMFGQDFNAHTYQRIQSCADHVHWNTAEAWSDIRTLGVTSTTDLAGGGHAHTGAMFYLGDNWPDRYRNSAFMCNIHGHRVNNDTLEFKGSSYLAKHGKDFLRVDDPWFRGMELRYGPDGGVFMTDWSDIGECHETDADVAHRENGRIYKITYGDVKPVKVDLSKLTDLELVKLQLHKNDWYVRQSRRLLQERYAQGNDKAPAHLALTKMFSEEKEPTKKLRLLWALQVTNALNEEKLVEYSKDQSDHVRAWVVRLLGDNSTLTPATLARLEALAKDDPSPRVRLSLASVLQRLPTEKRWGIAKALLSHSEDAGDAYIPLMTWYAVEPLVVADAPRAVDLVPQSRIPLVRRFIARRAVQLPGGGAELVNLLGRGSDPSTRLDVLLGMDDALRGLKNVVAPEGWSDLSERLSKDADPGVRKQAVLLSLLFGDPRAADHLRGTMKDRSADASERRDALQALADKKVKGLASELYPLIDDPAVRGPALRALAAYDDPGTPEAILKRYRTLPESDRDDAVNTLAARPASARALLDAVEHGTVPPRELSVTTARQLLALGDAAIAAKLEKVWGSIRPTSQAKVALVAKYKALLTPESRKAADPVHGRQVFKKTCVACHKLHDAGGDVGPDLTGSDRSNADYILENVLDPSATVGRDYKLNTIATNDGRLISGIIRAQNETSVVVQTVNERLTLDRGEIEALKPSDASMMPEGLFETLSDAEFRDLVAYLASKSQVPDQPSAARP